MKRWMVLLIVFGLVGSLIVMSSCSSGDLTGCAECMFDCIGECTSESIAYIFSVNCLIDCMDNLTLCSEDCLNSCGKRIMRCLGTGGDWDSDDSSDYTEYVDMSCASGVVNLVEGVDYEIIELYVEDGYFYYKFRILKDFEVIDFVYEIYAYPGKQRCEWESIQFQNVKAGYEFGQGSRHNEVSGAEYYEVELTSVRGIE